MKSIIQLGGVNLLMYWTVYGQKLARQIQNNITVLRCICEEYKDVQIKYKMNHIVQQIEKINILTDEITQLEKNDLSKIAKKCLTPLVILKTLRDLITKKDKYIDIESKIEAKYFTNTALSIACCFCELLENVYQRLPNESKKSSKKLTEEISRSLLQIKLF